MKKFLLMSVMLLMSTFGLGCGLSAEQRQEMIDDVRDRVTEVLVKKTEEIAGDFTKKAVESITKRATELGLTEEKAKKLAEEAAEHAKEALVKLVKEEVPPIVEKIANRVIPEATTAAGGTGKGFAGWLYMAAQGLLGLGKKGILGGVA